MPQLLVAGHRASAGMPGGEGVIWALCSQSCRKARGGEFLLLQNAGALGHSPWAGFPTTGSGREEGLGCRARDDPPALGQEYNVMLSLGCWSQLASGIIHYRTAFCRWVTPAGPALQQAELPRALGLFCLIHLCCSAAAPDHPGEKLGGTPAFGAQWGASCVSPLPSAALRHSIICLCQLTPPSATPALCAACSL